MPNFGIAPLGPVELARPLGYATRASSSEPVADRRGFFGARRCSTLERVVKFDPSAYTTVIRIEFRGARRNGLALCATLALAVYEIFSRPGD